MEALEEDIKNALRISNKSSALRNEYDNMTNYSRIYQNTTENIKDYMPILEGNYKSALLPTASGDHQLEAILMGVNDITCFDINKLAKYFVRLKLTAIEYLSKDDYIKFMYDDMLNKSIFDSIKKYLDNDTLVFWEELFKGVDIEKIKLCLFRLLGLSYSEVTGIDFSKESALKYTNYLQDDNYQLVQKRLKNTKIEYIDSNLLFLNEKLRHNYDLINLTNIYEYINRFIFLKGDIKFSKAVVDLIDRLNTSGKILISYLYKCSYKDLDQFKDKSLMYARIMTLLNELTLIKNIHDYHAYKSKSKYIFEKLIMFRNFQMMRHLKDFDICSYEVDSVGLGSGDCSKDMVLVYKK